MAKLEKKSKQNPKLAQTVLNDGRISLYLEYYLGRSSEPVLDEDGNQVYYTDGAMVGKPKYKVKHVRKKENLNLYLYANPKDQRERLQNKNTLKMAEDIRHEREKRFLEDREGYKFKKDNDVNFLDFFQQYIENSRKTKSKKHVAVMSLSLKRFKKFLSETPRYSAYSSYIRPDQITPEMVREFADYNKNTGHGQGPKTIFNRFKTVVNVAFEQDLMRKNPCQGVIVKKEYELTKDFLTLDEIKTLINTHYRRENSHVQRAFILTLFTGIRYCDVVNLTFRNVDYSLKLLRFEQIKTKDHSAHSKVTIPLNDDILQVIGEMPQDASLDSKLFNLPSLSGCLRNLKTWVKEAGINKHITWHCGRHSFAVNTLSTGANIKTVSTLMGHSSIKMTEKYLHVVDEQMSDAINNLGSIGYKEKFIKPINKRNTDNSD